LKLQLVRHATLLLDYAGMKVLIDPMLSDAGAMSAIQNSPQPRPNPLVPLPSLWNRFWMACNLCW
jgi:L-ascorbate metabolism protein UlaG (beta-lactamase superfamily)